MPLDYLRSIEYEHLPLTATDHYAVECIRVLKSAGLIEAAIVQSEAKGLDLAADVTAITDKGRVALALRAQGRPFP